jgi:outer membrane murein-binding lipoprotein Lpp
MFGESNFIYILALFMLFLPIYIFIWHLYKKIRYYEQKVINSPEFSYLARLLSFVSHVTSTRIARNSVPQLTLNSDKMADLTTNVRQTIRSSILTVAEIILSNCSDNELPANIEDLSTNNVDLPAKTDDLSSKSNEQKIEILKRAFHYQAIEDTLMNFILGC